MGKLTPENSHIDIPDVNRFRETAATIAALRSRAADTFTRKQVHQAIEEARERFTFANQAALDALRSRIEELERERDEASERAAENLRMMSEDHRRDIAEAREKAFEEAARVAFDYECSLADYGGSIDAKKFYEGGVADASVGIASALRALGKERT